MIGRRTRFSSRRLELFFNPDYAALVIDEVLSVRVTVLHIALVDSVYSSFNVINGGLESFEFFSAGKRVKIVFGGQAVHPVVEDLELLIKVFFGEFHRDTD